MGKLTNEDLQKFLEENEELMTMLGQCLRCPACEKIVKVPFYNLGEKYHWAEGCQECYETKR